MVKTQVLEDCRHSMLMCIIAVIFLMISAGGANAADAPALDSNDPAPQGISIVVNSKPLALDAAPIVENDRVLVPVKGIFEALGARVIWQANTQGIVVQKSGQTILMHLYHPLAYINDEPVVMDVPPVARMDRIYVPLRFVSQTMNSEVAWDPATQTVSINEIPQSAVAADYL